MKTVESDLEDVITLIPISINGRTYKVPAGLTIQKAVEYAGYKYVRGCGCRGGVCGACSTIYRTPDSPEIKVCLACQTQVIEGMSLMHMHTFPFIKALYDYHKLYPDANQIKKLYPEVEQCIGCNTCTMVCPQELQVMDYVTAALKGDFEKAAELSLGCIMCTLCGTQCPGELIPFYVALLCRRIYVCHISHKDNFLPQRINEIDQGIYNEELKRLINMDKDSFEDIYRKTQASKKMPES